MSDLAATIKHLIKDQGGTVSCTHLLSKDCRGGVAFLFELNGQKGMVKVIVDEEKEGSVTN